jgi:hypothetical protein
MNDERSPLPEFFQLVRSASNAMATSDQIVQHRQALISLIDFVREYDVTILAKLDDVS